MFFKNRILSKAIFPFCLFVAGLFIISCNTSTPKNVSKEEASKDTVVMKDELKNTNDSLISVITCPKCGHQKEEVMPTDYCVIRYTCENCQTIIYPKETDCCVYCSYGTKKCPSMQ